MGINRVIEGRFTGALSLANEDGTLYNQHIQTGELDIEASNPTPGGWALVPIVASGDPINIPDDWIHYGGDDISIVEGDVNHLQVYFKDSDTIYWTNKVE